MRTLRLAIAVLFALSTAPSVAFAADPPLVQADMRPVIDFESAYPPPGMTIGQYGSLATAWWGRVTNRNHTSGGAYGLWCAGVQGGVATETPASFTYLQGTDASATIDLTQTADYYSSGLEFWYTMQSLGSLDQESFNVMWFEADPEFPRDIHVGWPLTADNTWQRGYFDLSSTTSTVNLSREPGKVRFAFGDRTYSNEVVKIGQGVTVDDIRLTGHKYGPARAITTGQPGVAVGLSWDAPYRATGSTQVETRAVEYRVWRSVGLGPTYSWSERTPSRIATRSLVDTTVSEGASYTYLVQAWDPGAGTAYGVVATRSATVGRALSVDVSSSTSKTVAGQTVTYTYVVRNLCSAALPAVSVTDDRLGSVLASTPLAAGAQITTTAATAMGVTAMNVATARATDQYGRASTATDAVTVTVVHPAVSVAVSPDTTTAVQGQLVTYAYTVTNTGDVPLSSVSLTDDRLGTIATGMSLPVGGSATRWQSVAATESATDTVLASATYAPASYVVTAAAAASITVVHPAISVTKTVDAGAVLPGTTSNYTYVVRNSGDVSLIGCTLLDDKLGVVGTSFALAPGQIETRTASAVLSVDTTNTAIASGEYGADGTAFHGTVAATSSASVQVVTPQVRAEASVDQPVVLAGTEVLFTYTLSNPSTVTITGAALAVDGAVLIGPSVLPPGSSQVATRAFTASADVTRSVTASATFASIPLSDAATVAVDVIHPSLAMARSIDTSVQARGESVTHTFTVTNTGDVALTGVTATDSRLGTVLTPTTLLPGASAVRAYSVPATPGTAFLATATASDTLIGSSVSATEGVAVAVVDPAVTLVHSVDSTVVLSGPVRHDLTVTNAGDTALSGVTVTWPGGSLGPVGLSASEATSFSFLLDAQADAQVPADVTAVYGTSGTPFSGAVSDSAPVTLDVVFPSVTVAKAVDRPMVNPGVQVTYDYTVTNTGDTTLVAGSLTDAASGIHATGLSVAPGQAAHVATTAPATVSSAVGAAFAGQCQPAASITVTGASLPATVAVVGTRLNGTTRYESAVAMSVAARPGPLTGERAVVLASGAGWADALPASALCGVVDGPLLLVTASDIPDPVRAEILRLGAVKAYIVGGTGVIGPAVEAELADMGVTAERVFGANRYATARDVARVVVSKRGRGGTVFVATGSNYADALSASSLAAALKAPIVLTYADSLPADTVAALADIRPEIAVVCGGTGVVSTAVEATLAAGTFGRPQVARRSGPGRYDTALSLVQYGFARGLAPGGARGVYLSTGSNYPDALAGGALAATRGGVWSPLMLTTPSALAPQAVSAITGTPPMGFVTVLGGTGAVAASVESEARGLIE